VDAVTAFLEFMVHHGQIAVAGDSHNRLFECFQGIENGKQFLPPPKIGDVARQDNRIAAGGLIGQPRQQFDASVNIGKNQ
jgi:hypothetical protein